MKDLYCCSSCGFLSTLRLNFSTVGDALFCDACYPTPPRPRRRLFVEVSQDDAAFWAEHNRGTWRGDLWKRVLSEMKGCPGAVARWWPSRIKRHPDYAGHGLVEVVAP